MSTSSEDEYKPAIVLDNGSHKIKAGFSGDDAPRCVIPNIIGYPHNTTDFFSLKQDDGYYVGDRAMQKRECLSIRCPIEHGIISNWKDMERIWSYMFKQELRIPTEEYGVLITEPQLNPVANQEMTAQVMFESFNVPLLYSQTSGSLALYASGRGCGINVDIGDAVTYIWPLYEGYCPINAIKRVDIGGRDLTKYMQTLLMQKGYSFTTFSELQEVRQMKERFCFLSQSSKKTDPVPEKTFALPDGSSVILVVTHQTEAVLYTHHKVYSVENGSLKQSKRFT